MTGEKRWVGHIALSTMLAMAGCSGSASVTNSCNRDVNMLEFSTGSRGLFVVPGDSTLIREETIVAWGACISPAIPTRTGDFEYFCE